MGVDLWRQGEGGWSSDLARTPAPTPSPALAFLLPLAVPIFSRRNRPDDPGALAEGWRQDRVERKANRQSCSICVGIA
jgi:hypothetical protein